MPKTKLEVIEHRSDDLRDYFAAKAMQAFMSNERYSFGEGEEETVARYSYQMADIMLKVRKEKK